MPPTLWIAVSVTYRAKQECATPVFFLLADAILAPTPRFGFHRMQPATPVRFSVMSSPRPLLGFTTGTW